MAIRRLDFKSDIIRIYNDIESCCIIIIANFGEHRILNYDDNFFWVGELYNSFVSLVDDYYNNDIEDDGRKKLVKRFERHLKNQGVTNEELIESREYYENQQKR